MKDTPPSDDIAVPGLPGDAIEQIRVRFDAELNDNLNPQIEKYLERVSDDSRKRLLRELVATDFNFRRQHGKQEFADYFVRFPQHADALFALKRDLDSNEETRAADFNTPGVTIAPPRQNSTDSADVKITPALRPSSDETVLAETMPQPNFSRFKILKLAGSGGFGAVWQAYDLVLQREVAVKVPRADRVLGSGTIREARAAANLTHPNIVQVFEIGQEGGLDFIVTAYVNGINLKEWLKKNSLDPWKAAQLVATVATAIQHAHDKSVIHRDLKLTNVLMDEKGKPHIVDFGIAKQEAKDDSLAVHGQAVGTPAYMSPEQALGDHGAVGRQSDVYAIGVMLYELLTGTTPFRGDVPELLRQIVHQAPVSPRQIKPGIPRDLERICLKCLAKDRDKRYQTAQALADDLNRFLNGETLQGIPVAMPDRAWKWCVRNRKKIATSCTLAFVVSMTSIGLMAWRHQSAVPSVPLVPILFTTDPKGCEITVVPIDHETGEPDPSRIQHLKGKTTPLTMNLAGGDYLVEAVLYSDKDRNGSRNIVGFGEVFRHVPTPEEISVTPLGHLHTTWTKRNDGKYEVSQIKIPPRADLISSTMAYCAGADNYEEPRMRRSRTTKTWQIPPFYIDRNKMSVDELKSAGFYFKGWETSEGSTALLSYHRWVEALERSYKRPPSAVELYLMTKLKKKTVIGADSQNDESELPTDKTPIIGLHSGAWEWTSTKPGGPFSGSFLTESSIPQEESGLLRMSGCGTVDRNNSPLRASGFITRYEKESFACRGVRSANPRLTPRDFLQLKTEIEVPQKQKPQTGPEARN